MRSENGVEHSGVLTPLPDEDSFVSFPLGGESTSAIAVF
jgi:hypothetical protein